MSFRHFPFWAGLFSLLASCSKPIPNVTEAERAVEINKAFETPKPYAARTLDSLDIAHFLTANPDLATDSTAIRAFYRGRGNQFAWFVNDTLSSAAGNMMNLLAPPDSSGMDPWWSKVDAMLNDQPATPPSDSLRLQLEIGLTARYFRLAEKEYGGYIKGDLHALDWYIPRRKKNYAMLLDSLVAGRKDLSPIEPVHPQYKLLKAQLKRYYALQGALNGNPIQADGKKFAFGDSAAALREVRNRLALLGDLAVSDSSAVLDSTLFNAIRHFQQRMGFSATGLPGAATMAALNTPVKDRIRTILVNMERLRWVNPNPPADFLLVNIPEYRLHVFEQGKEAWGMDVVVGASATHTVIFNGELSMIAFAPTWSVPVSIIRSEIAPAMRKNAGYLAKHNMDLVRGEQVVPTSSVDWASWQGGGGYYVRQRPGKNNSLGLVKFLFPNEYSIYFHDTPAKSRFLADKRAFSHGCIRLSQPQRLAEYLLRNDSTWTPAAISKAMHASAEKVVKVKPPMPVSIVYFTAWVDGNGAVNFRDDVYGHDARLALELFAPETMLAAKLPKNEVPADVNTR